ncbi:hypothetical protein [Rothia sp. P5766]|uniref:hypothetical protein n=1 Tax=Rothia sp. P5766 TaxID=3402656 RepID=UPI003ADE19A4
MLPPETMPLITAMTGGLCGVAGTWIGARVAPKHVVKASEMDAQTKLIEALSKRIDQQDTRADKMQAELDKTHEEVRSAQQAADEAQTQTRLHRVWNQNLVAHIEAGAPPPPPDPPTGLVTIVHGPQVDPSK